MRGSGVLFWAILLFAGADARAQETADLVPVGRRNWESPWMPDFSLPGKRVSIPVDRRVDVLILGDGFLTSERSDFIREVEGWYAKFLTLTPWKELSGAFRVRGLWIPSEARATPEMRSHFRLPSTTSGVGDVMRPETARAVFAAIERSKSNSARSGSTLTHTVVVLLVRNARGRNPSGLSRTLASPGGKRRVRVGFAAYTHHEFGHSYGGLRDEYIRGEGSRTGGRPPQERSIFTVSNLGYTRRAKDVPWAHLAAGSAANPDRASVIGALWIGGVAEIGVWHSEPRCMMNGRHENWDFAKTDRGARLRDRDRFCFWCEEILVARTCHRAGLLGESTDGALLWKKWAGEIRPEYQRLFKVRERIRARNAEYVREKLSSAKIYERPN